MGWDMYAVNKNGTEKLTAEQKAVFKAASDLVASEADSVDGLLDGGALDCSVCARAMEDMTGHSAWSDWTPEEMAERFASAKIPDDLTAESLWPYLSAYHFMRVCTELGLGANASY